MITTIAVVGLAWFAVSAVVAVVVGKAVALADRCIAEARR